MPRIAIIDDDFAMENLVDFLGGLGHEVVRYKSAAAALAALDSVAQSDLVILDVLMERPSEIPEEAAHGGHRTGVELAKRIRLLAPRVKFVAFSAAHDPDVAEFFRSQPGSAFFSKLSMPSLAEIGRQIDALVGGATPPRPTPFIVHGHDEAAKLALKNYLQNTLGFPEPVILHEQPSGGRTIIEKLEHYGTRCELVFVLLSPDDAMAASPASNDTKRRARQNVIFELGYFLGALGRVSGRVLLLYKGPLDLPSDLSGVVYIDVSDGVPAAGETIRQELQHALSP